MKALRVVDRRLVLVDVPDPVAGPGEVVVQVRAAGVNRADLLQVRGLYPAPPGWPADIPGIELAGVISACGSGVAGWQVGDRVMAVVGGGAYATACAVPAAELLPIPEGLDFVQAAAVPEAFTTAADAWRQAGACSVAREAGGALEEERSGDPDRAGRRDVLVFGATGGVGTAAVQLARAFGCRVAGTSRSAWKLRRLEEFGVALAVDASSGPRGEWVGRVRRAVPAGFSAVLDLVGGPWTDTALALCGPRGTVVLVGLLAGARAEIDLAVLLRRRLHLVGTVLRSRSPRERAELAEWIRRHVVPLFDAGRVRPVVGAVVPASRAAEAHEQVRRGEVFGKVVLTWSE